MVLDIRSGTGIGNAEIAGLTNDVSAVTVRLHIAGLEQLRFEYASIDIEASVPSSGDRPIMQRVIRLGGQSEMIGSDSPYWLAIEPTSSSGEPAESIPLDGGYFKVTPPNDFFHSQPDRFSVSWIDFYR